MPEGKRMVKCWAKSLNDCSQEQSKEHALSKGIWRNAVITFEGFRWTKGQARQLPVKKVGRKMLCTSHNSRLSHLDAIAKKLFEVGARFHNNQSDRGKLKRSAIWKVDRAEFNGYDLERLLAKVAVGTLQEEPETNWHLNGTVGMKPPEKIVEVIFENGTFDYPMGLFLVNSVGDTIINEDRVTIHTLLHPETNGFVGAIIGIRHWQFWINLSDVDPNEYSMESLSGRIIGRDGSAPVYRVQTINLNAGAKLSGQITFIW